MALVLINTYTPVVVRNDRDDTRLLTYEPDATQYVNKALVNRVAIVEDQKTAINYYAVYISTIIIYTDKDGVELLEM